MEIDPLNQYEWNALLPAPLAAEILHITSQELLVMLANQAHRIDGDHPVAGKKYPVTIYFHREDLGNPAGIFISGRSDWRAKQFIFKLATDGAAELPLSFGHGPLRLEHRDVFLMVYIVRRLRFLMGTAPKGGDDHPGLTKLQVAVLRMAEGQHYFRQRMKALSEAAEEQEIPAPVSIPAEAPEPPERRHERQPRKQGGRPKTQLRLGVEALYLEKLAAGQTDILLPGNVEISMLELRRIVNEDGELSDKIKEHVRQVSKPSGQWAVHVQNPPDTGGKVLRKNEKPGGYDKKAVSNCLSDLRKEHPVE